VWTRIGLTSAPAALHDPCRWRLHLLQDPHEAMA